MCLCMLELHTFTLRSIYTCAEGDFNKEIHFMIIVMIKVSATMSIIVRIMKQIMAYPNIKCHAIYKRMMCTHV